MLLWLVWYPLWGGPEVVPDGCKPKHPLIYAD